MTKFDPIGSRKSLHGKVRAKKASQFARRLL